jgi:circadian clock protein KaiB
MAQKLPGDVTERYQQASQKPDTTRFVLRLYVTGATPASTRAIARLRKLCEENLKEQIDLEVIDIFQQPSLAQGDQIIATPTLVKLLPPPLQRFVGDLEGLDNKLFGFEVRPRAEVVERAEPPAHADGH